MRDPLNIAVAQPLCVPYDVAATHAAIAGGGCHRTRGAELPGPAPGILHSARN
jgi:hypothetical protein